MFLERASEKVRYSNTRERECVRNSCKLSTLRARERVKIGELIKENERKKKCQKERAYRSGHDLACGGGYYSSRITGLRERVRKRQNW